MPSHKKLSSYSSPLFDRIRHSFSGYLRLSSIEDAESHTRGHFHYVAPAPAPPAVQIRRKLKHDQAPRLDVIFEEDLSDALLDVGLDGTTEIAADTPSGNGPVDNQDTPDASSRAVTIPGPQAETSVNLSELTAEAIVKETVEEARHRFDNLCILCNNQIGDRRSYRFSSERKAYLPCGHFFGHQCIFSWLNYHQGQRKRCPRNDCISLRHECEHHAVPTTQPNERPFTDVNKDRIPWRCEFCETNRGFHAIESSKKSVEKHKHASKGLKARKDNPSRVVWSLRERYHSSRVASKEAKLDKQANEWFLWKWSVFEYLCRRQKKREDKEEERERERRAFLEGVLVPLDNDRGTTEIVQPQPEPQPEPEPEPVPDKLASDPRIEVKEQPEELGQNEDDGGERVEVGHQPQPKPLAQEDQVASNQRRAAGEQVGDLGHTGHIRYTAAHVGEGCDFTGIDFAGFGGM
ncbi:hypothetical protein AK830_g5292 [Neonectria ditissima]|uniref:RING-type domain-containing protein n=1 Tax=Neonectria ditissima TaxID=78410 RepID=A0A0N8H7B0_9HYPO|nr:hypothetical protein AK830_g5292 [Neonectria ditissima]